MIHRRGQEYRIVEVPGVQELRALASNRLKKSVRNWSEAGRYRWSSVETSLSPMVRLCFRKPLLGVPRQAYCDSQDRTGP